MIKRFNPLKSFDRKLLYHHHWFVFKHCLTYFHNDSGNFTVFFSFDIVLHFHCFQHKNSVACLHFLTNSYFDRCNGARKWGFNSV